MKKYCKALANITIALIILLLIIFAVPRGLVFFSPFVVGWVVALLARPLVHFFEEKLKQFMSESDSKISGIRQYSEHRTKSRRR